MNCRLDDRTIVFFTSDNGPHREGGNDPAFANSNGPLRGIKRSLHDGGIRVPLIVRWPGHIAAAQTSDWIGGFQDVLPTLAELAEATDAVPDRLGRYFVRAHAAGTGRASASTTICTGRSTNAVGPGRFVAAPGRPCSSRSSIASVCTICPTIVGENHRSRGTSPGARPSS